MNHLPQLPELPGRAAEVVRKIEKTWRDCERGKRDGYEVALYVASPFGTHRVSYLCSQADHLLLLNIQTGEEHDGMLYCPVEQVAFLFRHFQPTEEKERVIVGFGYASDESKK